MVLLFGSLWVLFASVRLIVGRERRTGGLLSPLALRVAGTIFGIIPVIALFTGAYWEARWGWVRVIQAIGYFTAMAALFRLASSRTAVLEVERNGDFRADA
jgi:hypothetical protein